MVLSERDGLDCRLPRRNYSITEAGEDYLEFWANSLAEYRENMDLFLEVYAGGIGCEARVPEKEAAGFSSRIRARR
jgi:DNA-binding PadR family transcriptional regulator